MKTTVLLSIALVSVSVAEAPCEQKSQTEELAKENQNPVANLISVRQFAADWSLRFQVQFLFPE